jgi:hypothetical protein
LFTNRHAFLDLPIFTNPAIAREIDKSLPSGAGSKLQIA